MTPFDPNLEILPPTQKAIWPSLDFTRTSGFVLYGGTALALRLGHRASVDFYFFSFRPLDPSALHRSIPLLANAEILQLESNTLTVLAGAAPDQHPVKLSFFGGLGFQRIEEAQPTSDGVLLVASLPDLFATKLNVIYQRAEAKDYLDIHAILNHGLSLKQGIDFATQVFGPNFNAMLPMQALCYFEEPALRKLPESVKTDLRNAVAQLR